MYNFVKPIVKPLSGHYTRHMLKERQAEIWSERVFRLRLQLGLSQSQMAERLGSTRVSVTNWELGKHAPTPVFQGKIAALEAQESDGRS